jgi:hypothetical protein
MIRLLVEGLRTLMVEGKLTNAQLDALRKFSQAGGHGYGEYAYLNRRTAQALQKMGLVKLGTRSLGDGRSMGLGRITLQGIRVLAAIQAGAMEGELFDKIAAGLINSNSDLVDEYRREAKTLGDRKSTISKFI